MHMGGRREFGSINIFFYADGSPFMVGKFAPGKSSLIEREGKNLDDVQELIGDTDLAVTIEKKIGHYKIDGEYILLKEFMSGTDRKSVV